MKLKYTCNAARWFDKVNGNTYHSVRIMRHKDGKVIVHEWTYGYDDHYRQTALETMQKAGWLPEKYKENLMCYERENDYPILWEVSDGLKRDMIANSII